MKYLTFFNKQSKLLFILFVFSMGMGNTIAQTTSIVATFCDNTLPAIGSNISAVKYSGATKYRFKVMAAAAGPGPWPWGAAGPDHS